MLRGLDFSFGNGLTVAQIQKAGFQFVCRYLSGDGTKDIGPQELKNYLANGIAVVFVWETDGLMPSQAQGKADAQRAQNELNQLAKALNDPSVSAASVFFAADAPSESDLTGYMAGVNSVIGVSRTGIYGGLQSVQDAFNGGLVTYGWQTYAWSGTPTVWDDRALLRQTLNGVMVGPCDADLDEAAYWNSSKVLGSGDDFGQFPRPVQPTNSNRAVASGRRSLHAAAAAAHLTVEQVVGFTVNSGQEPEIAALAAYLGNGDFNSLKPARLASVSANAKMPKGLVYYVG